MRPAGSDDQRTTWERRFDGLRLSTTGSLGLVDAGPTTGPLADADAAVVPVDWYWVRGPSWATRPDRALAAACRSFARRAVERGAPVVVFFGGDRSCDRVPIPGAIVFREGGYRSRMTARDVAMPAFAEDLLAEHHDGRLVEREKGPLPVVGFCGLARRQGGLKLRLRLALYHAVVLVRDRRWHPSPYLGENIRTTAIDALAASPRVATNFVIRETSTFFKDAAPRDLVDVRREYVENLVDCDYVLCARGSGNYSYRLYEALSLGRIPVLIDTDCALPFADEVDWRRHCIWVDADEVERIAEIVADHHERIDPRAFVELQHANRRLWVDRLSPSGFFSQFERLVRLRHHPGHPEP